MTTTLRIWLVTGTWLGIVVGLVGWSIRIGASLTASALVLASCLAPAAIVVMLGLGAPSPPVSEWLHVVDRSVRVE